MGKDGSIAPKERINIRYVPATGDQQEEMELPLRMVVLGDFLGRDQDCALEDVDMLSVDKNSFSSVLSEAGLERSITVQNTLEEGDPDATLSVDLKIKTLKDFEPDSIVRQVPELAKLSLLREALVALKGPLGNMPAFRNRIETLLVDEGSREALLAELDGMSVQSTDNTDLNSAFSKAGHEAAGDDVEEDDK